MSLVKKLGLAGVLAVSGMGYSGCAPLGAVFERSDNPLVSLLGTGMRVEGGHQNRMEEAKVGRSEVNVYNQENMNNGNIQWEKPYGDYLVLFNDFRDLNHDDVLDKEELFGLGKSDFDIRKEKMALLFFKPGYHGTVNLQSWTPSGKLVGGYKKIVDKGEVLVRATGPQKNFPTEGDLMDNIKGRASGKYVITVTLDNGKVYRKEVEVRNFPRRNVQEKKEPEKPNNDYSKWKNIRFK